MIALRVLVIEDDAVVSLLLAEVLRGMGHEVCGIATTESYAVAAATWSKPDMMIVDARLGDGSGIDAVDEILRTGFVPHVYACGDALRVRSLKPNAVVLQKPFREADLALAMQSALGAAATA
jgi:two-component system, response regulator PdtaR